MAQPTYFECGECRLADPGDCLKASFCPHRDGALSRAEREALDVLGPTLCRLSTRSVNLSWAGSAYGVAGFYHVDWRDNRGRFFSGAGDTPSQAIDTAIANASPVIPLTAIIVGRGVGMRVAA